MIEQVEYCGILSEFFTAVVKWLTYLERPPVMKMNLCLCFLNSECTFLYKITVQAVTLTTSQ